ncbi:MAG: replication-associated recombination protein A, partial [Alphaproteobacteria bacterium]|nr:replication-associated recombination protein A [Alphaproteobacteria bacterium]
MTSLFPVSNAEAEALRPLADRMRPRRLEDVAGQDHLLGPQGALRRLIEARSLGSLIFWG